MKYPRIVQLVFLMVLFLSSIVTVLRLTLNASAEQTDAGDNATWEEVGVGSASGGGISNTEGESRIPDLAVNLDSNPIVVWQDDVSGDQEIYLLQWNGVAWVEIGTNSAALGGISDNDGDSGGPSLAIDSSGQPLVAWTDNSSGNWEIYVRRWDGMDWVELGTGSASGGGISDNSGISYSPSLVIAPDQTPIVAWADRTSGEDEIYVRRWNGVDWVEMGAGSAVGGGISNNSGRSHQPSLAVSSSGEIAVAWTDNSGFDEEIYVRKWDGAGWVEVGAGSANGGGVSSNQLDSSYPSLALESGGNPIVAWADTSSGEAQIYVRRFDGVQWKEMGVGSASGGGMSNTEDASRSPSLAIQSNNAPIVAWVNWAFDREIYVRRWNGSDWVQIGTDSAGGEGISRNDGTSDQPSLAIGPNGFPIAAWEDDTSGAFEVYLRSYSEAFAPCFFLSRVHTGSGLDPTASPDSSSGCSQGQYTAGQPINLTAYPSNGWRVAGWTGTNANTSTDTVNSLIMPASNHTVSVNYEEIPPDCYKLNRTHTGQGADPVATPANSPGCAEDHYTVNEAIGLTAFPASGWRVTNWGGTNNNSSTALTNSLNMPAANHTVGVTYEEAPATCYQLLRAHSGQGADPDASPPSSVGCSVGQYTSGETISLIAEPAPGWLVDAWNGTSNDNSTQSTNSLVMPPDDHLVSVKYVERPADCFNLMLARSGEGTLPTASPSSSTGCPNGRYLAGETISLSSMPADGWIIAGWMGTNNDVSTLAMNAVDMPTRDHTVTVIYLPGIMVTNRAYMPIQIGD